MQFCYILIKLAYYGKVLKKDQHIIIKCEKMLYLGKKLLLHKKVILFGKC